MSVCAQHSAPILRSKTVQWLADHLNTTTTLMERFRDSDMLGEAVVQAARRKTVQELLDKAHEEELQREMQQQKEVKKARKKAKAKFPWLVVVALVVVVALYFVVSKYSVSTSPIVPIANLLAMAFAIYFDFKMS